MCPERYKLTQNAFFSWFFSSSHHWLLFMLLGWGARDVSGETTQTTAFNAEQFAIQMIAKHIEQ